MADVDDLWDQARHNLLAQLTELEITNKARSEMALNIAEAYAWLMNVSQPHGGRASLSSGG